MSQWTERFPAAWHLLLPAGLLWVGCAAPPPPPVVEQAPYALAGEGRLRIREDLAGHVETAPARASGDSAVLEGFGQVRFAPGASYALRTPFDGFVEKVHVQVGQRVEAGALLATLRSSELAKQRAEVRRLAATLETERDGLARTERLLDEGAASPRELVEAQGRIRVLEAELSGLRESLSAVKLGGGSAAELYLRAPTAGDVLARSIAPGELARSGEGDPAFLIGDSSSLVVSANFPEREVSLLAEGSPCSFVIPSLGAEAHEGRVTSVMRAMDPQTRTGRIVCTPTAMGAGKLRSEMAARVTVKVVGDDTLVVPRSAVLLRRDAHVVLVRTGERELERRTVTMGQRLGGDVQVLSGLRAEEEVVVKGAVLFDGELDQLL